MLNIMVVAIKFNLLNIYIDLESEEADEKISSKHLFFCITQSHIDFFIMVIKFFSIESINILSRNYLKKTIVKISLHYQKNVKITKLICDMNKI